MAKSNRKDYSIRPMKMDPTSDVVIREVTIPANDKPTQIRITVEFVHTDKRPGELEPLLGDGFIAPNKLRWAGKEATLSIDQWNLLDLLLKSPEKRMQEWELMEALDTFRTDEKGKQTKPTTAAGLKKLAQRLNEPLGEVDFWGRVRYRQAGAVAWYIIEDEH